MILYIVQCDQIGRFIALWSTFQSLRQQLFCPSCPHFQAIFVKVTKYFIFLVESFLGNFIDIWQLVTLILCLTIWVYLSPPLSAALFQFWIPPLTTGEAFSFPGMGSEQKHFFQNETKMCSSSIIYSASGEFFDDLFFFEAKVGFKWILICHVQL